MYHNQLLTDAAPIGLTPRQWLIGVVLLWVSVVVSALMVVYTTYQSRVTFDLLEGLKREKSQLHITWGQYLLEESTWAGYGRIERVAKEQLLMAPPLPEKVVVVNPDAS